MSVINEMANPMDPKKPFVFAKGSIKFISIKPVKDGPNVVDGVKTTWIKMPGQPDKKIEATHSISFLMQEVDENNNVIDPNSAGEWIGMGEKKMNKGYESQVQIKVDNAWKEILQGMVISVPLKITRNNDGRTFTNAALAKVTILDESKAGQAQPRQQGGNSGGGKSQGGGQQLAGTKIFGNVVAIDGNSVTIDDENIGQGVVILNDEQLAKVSVGGRMGAQVDTSNGHVLSNFRSYGPAGSGGGGGNRPKKGPYDQAGVSTGHALNVVGNLLAAGWRGNYFEAGRVSHDVTTRLIKEYSEKAGKDEGQSVGNAVKFAATDLAVNQKPFTAENLEANARTAYEDLAARLYEAIKAHGREEGSNAPQGVPEPLAQQPAPASQPRTQAPPPPTTYDVPLDFDDDIPFAPVGLQYARHAIYVL